MNWNSEYAKWRALRACVPAACLACLACLYYGVPFFGVPFLACLFFGVPFFRRAFLSFWRAFLMAFHFWRAFFGVPFFRRAFFSAWFFFVVLVALDKDGLEEVLKTRYISQADLTRLIGKKIKDEFIQTKKKRSRWDHFFLYPKTYMKNPNSVLVAKMPLWVENH